MTFKNIPRHQPQQQQINTRINLRFQPDETLQPNFDPRAVPTKRVFQPTYTTRSPYSVSIKPSLAYSPHTNFNPGNSRGPVNGALNAVNDESSLRNLGRAIEKARTNAYIPSSSSDLYNANTTVTSSPSQQPHPNLFNKMEFEEIGNFHPNIGNATFHNHTRTQLRSQEN